MSGAAVLQDPQPSSPPDSASSGSEPASPKEHHVFNEQTNYVPRSTIITVMRLPHRWRILMANAATDIFGLLDSRPHSFNGPDYPSRQLVNYWKRAERQR